MLRFLPLALAAAGVTVACTAGLQPAKTVSTPHESMAGAGSQAAVQGEKPVKPSKVSRTGENVSRLYRETCAKCHGDRGQGGGGGTATLLTREKFDQKYDRPFFDAIKDGVPDAGMEAYGPTMSNEEIWGLVVHLRELQAQALRADEGGPAPVNGVYASKYGRYNVEDVVPAGRGLRVPWGIDWLPDGSMLVTNRPGGVLLVRGDKLTPIEGIPTSVEIGQGGMMEVAVHPDYRRNGWIYLGYTEPAKAPQQGGQTKIIRGKLDLTGSTPRWTGQQTIFEAPAASYNRSGVHFGTRIVFDKGKIFFSIGERGNQNLAQDLSKPNGKIYRVNEDGTIPRDNPFVNEPAALPAIWSYGHRNPQGLAMTPDGDLWDTEHGPRGGDELNRVVKGGNYGWPVIAFSINYNDSAFTIPWAMDGKTYQMPAFRWLPSIGACGLDTYRGNAFPRWRGDLLAGGLSGQNVDRIRVKNGKLVEREELIFGLGRVREVAVGPDGFVYVALNDPDKIIRLVPAN